MRSRSGMSSEPEENDSIRRLWLPEGAGILVSSPKQLSTWMWWASIAHDTILYGKRQTSAGKNNSQFRTIKDAQCTLQMRISKTMKIANCRLQIIAPSTVFMPKVGSLVPYSAHVGELIRHPNTEHRKFSILRFKRQKFIKRIWHHWSRDEGQSNRSNRA